MNWDIYNVNEKIDYLLNKYMDAGTGEIDEQAVAQLQELGLERSDLIKNLALAVKRNMSYIAGMKNEKTMIDARIKSAERSSNWLIQQVQNNITEGEKIKEPLYELKWTTSTKLNIDEFERNAEADYKDKTFKKFVKKKVVTTYEFDKSKISTFIKIEKDGKLINKLKGIFISQTKNLKIK